MAFQWVSRQQADAYGPQAIVCLYLCAYPPSAVDPENSNLQTNHWTVFACLNTGESIRMDPGPSGMRQTLLLRLEMNTCTYTEHAVKVVALQTQNLTVNGLLEVIRSAGADRYGFTDTGNGCRYWIYKVVELLRTHGHLPNEQEVATATQALARVWKSSDELVASEYQSDMAPGRFY